MPDAPATSPPPAKKGWLRAGVVGVVGLFGGSATMYVTAIFDSVVKPAKPVANFEAKAAGLDVTCENKSIGESGWWDFGDGSALVPFDPTKATVAHSYAKSGTYTVKLTVRNFLMDENVRTVPVDLGTATAPSALPPSITGLTVVPIGSSAVAPATFKVVGQVQNADKSMINTTAGTLKETPAGVVEELVVFDKPGTYAIDLIATSSKAGPVKQTAYVTVGRAALGTLSATVRVVDTGMKVEKQPYVETCTFPVPTKQNSQKTFEKRLHAPSGCVFKEVAVAAVTGKATGNVRVELEKEGKAARVLGDWIVGPDAAAQAAGGGEVFITLKGSAEKHVAVNPKQNRMTDTVSLGGTLSMKLPKRPGWMSAGTRQVLVELTETEASGPRTVLAKELLPTTGVLVRQVVAAGRTALAQARLVGDTVEFTVR
ncbi:MAG TPA: PKD domain-containing protein [Fimbriiglobus sp.]|jgi:PKD repeat protein